MDYIIPVPGKDKQPEPSTIYLHNTFTLTVKDICVHRQCPVTAQKGYQLSTNYSPEPIQNNSFFHLLWNKNGFAICLKVLTVWLFSSQKGFGFQSITVKEKKEKEREKASLHLVTDLTLKFALGTRHSCPYAFTGKPQTKTIPEQHTSVAAIYLSGTSARCLGTQTSAAMVTQ